MNQRLVKPAFWPVLVCSSVFLAASMYFLIGGMLSNRMEDILIAAITGFVLFLATISVKNNANDPPKVALVLLFIWPVIMIVFGVMMNNNLTRLDANIGQIFTYLREMLELRGDGRAIPDDLHRSFFLSGGIIATVIFVVAQVAACLLLFIGTKPSKENFRH